MAGGPTPADYEALMRRYFDACNAADYDALVACFTPDAVHYFPPGLDGVPWRSADRIARGWQQCVATLGSQWTVDRLIVSHDSPEAVMEWTHWKNASGTVAGSMPSASRSSTNRWRSRRRTSSIRRCPSAGLTRSRRHRS